MIVSMAKFSPLGVSQVLIYVDDVLIASLDKEICKNDMLELLKYLA